MGDKHARAKEAPAACSDCDRVLLEQTLAAEEAQRAHLREMERLEREHEYALEALGHRRDIDLATVAAEHKAGLDAAVDAHHKALEAASHAADLTSRRLFEEALVDVAKGSIDRSRDSARFMRTGAAAVAAIYVGALALVFAVTGDPLPVRGVVAPVFLGLAVALASASLASRPKSALPADAPVGASLLTEYVDAVVGGSRWAVHAAAISLGVGVAFVAAPFVGAQQTDFGTAPDWVALGLAAAGALLVLLGPKLLFDD